MKEEVKKSFALFPDVAQALGELKEITRLGSENNVVNWAILWARENVKSLVPEYIWQSTLGEVECAEPEP